MFTCFFHIALKKSTAVNRTRFFPSPFFIFTIRFLILAEAFWNDHVAACSTALRSATEKNEMGGYVTIPCSSKMSSVVTQPIGLNSSDVTRLVATEQIFTFKITLCNNSCISYCKLVDTVNLVFFTVQVN